MLIKIKETDSKSNQSKSKSFESKFNFIPLMPASAAGESLDVICCITKARMKWGEARRAGWVADMNGRAFVSYYSPEGRETAEKQERAEMGKSDK